MRDGCGAVRRLVLSCLCLAPIGHFLSCLLNHDFAIGLMARRMTHLGG
ncbi:hypothetical protein OAD74_06425 [Alphaproteobacteria bacterium]|nr:hypothetical protein [Alphaproteobacteria bacterium]